VTGGNRTRLGEKSDPAAGAGNGKNRYTRKNNPLSFDDRLFGPIEEIKGESAFFGTLSPMCRKNNPNRQKMPNSAVLMLIEVFLAASEEDF